MKRLDDLIDGAYIRRHSAWRGRGRGNYPRIIETLESGAAERLEPIRDELRRRLDMEAFFVRVQSVEEVVLDEWVYDLEVEDTHNYIANGLISHNTTALSILSQKLSDWGFRVLVAPEVATMLISGGITDIGAIAADRDRFRELETHFLAFQRKPA